MMKKTLFSYVLILWSGFACMAGAQKSSGEKIFLKHADECLSVMEQAALKMQVKGVAVLAFIPGESTETWISKMKVVGSLSNESANYLSIAYSKAGEMAETFQDSGRGIREPKTGEFGWKGGIIKKTKSGYLLAVFSGGSGEQDREIATKGIDYLKDHY